MNRFFIFILFVLLLFTGCNFKNPFAKKSEIEMANKCKEKKSSQEKISCYEDMPSNSYANLRLGIYYANKENFEKAFYHINSSYSKGNPHANIPLALLYMQEKGVKKDYKKALEILSSNQQNNPNALYHLSKLYFLEEDNIQDTKKGLELLKQSAQMGNLAAQKKLYYMYENGIYGIKKDSVEAGYWKNKMQNNQGVVSLDIYEL